MKVQNAKRKTQNYNSKFSAKGGSASGGKIKKVAKIGAVTLAAVLILAVFYFYVGLSAKPPKMQWGITFSKSYAESLGLSWKEAYIAILDELEVDHLRLSAYWSEIESNRDRYDFRDMDFMVQEAAKRKVKIILAVGRRLPRWPECHVPEWAKSLPEYEQQQRLLGNVAEVVKRYRLESQIEMWQVENEFFLRGFGECPKADPDFLDAEIALVKSLDGRPVLLTDSGELGGWYGTMRRADVFGTTMYRIIHNKFFGFVEYPISPIYYKRRFLLYKPFVRADKIINVELQAEPWAKTNLREDPLETQYISFGPEQFRKNIEYARSSGISPAYLWGAEWWYYLKKERGVDTFWEEAKKLWVQ